MNVILCSFPDISWGNTKPQTANMIQLPLILVLIIIWKVKEGGNLRCLHREGTVASPRYVDATAAWRPLCLYSCTYHVQFFSSAYSTLRTCANTVWKKGKFNGYCNECWLSGSEKQEEKKKRKCAWILRGAEEGLFRCSGIVGFHEEEWFGGETWLFFPFCFFLVHRGVVCYKKAGRSLDTHH